MNAQLTIILKDHVVAYVKGQLDKQDEVIIEEVIRTDERARSVYVNILCALKKEERSKAND